MASVVRLGPAGTGPLFGDGTEYTFDRAVVMRLAQKFWGPGPSLLIVVDKKKELRDPSISNVALNDVMK